MSLKRLVPLVVLACIAAATIASSAAAGGIRDWEPCPDSGGVLTCPPATEGVPYSIKLRAVEEPPCQPGEDFWHYDGGSPPPGLSLSSEGTLSGTPTQAGTFRFWVEMQLPDNDHCNGTADTTQEEFSLTVVPGVPRLVIGPESTAPGTVGAAYSLQMTATVSDPKTWSIVDGALPPGLALGSSNGLISGTPSAEGTFNFTVRAATADGRADTKALGIAIRSAVTIAGDEAPASEIGIPLLLQLTAAGGTGMFTWTLSAGALPSGVTLAPNGTIAGIPAQPGKFAFAVTVTDTEGRQAVHSSRLTVADRIALSSSPLRPAKVGRYYQAKLRTTGGVLPATWVKRGPLPKGMRFDRTLGMLYGAPTRAGKYRIRVEVRDALGVKATGTVVLVVQAAKAKPRR